MRLPTTLVFASVAAFVMLAACPPAAAKDFDIGNGVRGLQAAPEPEPEEVEYEEVGLTEDEMDFLAGGDEPRRRPDFSISLAAGFGQLGAFRSTTAWSVQVSFARRISKSLSFVIHMDKLESLDNSNLPNDLAGDELSVGVRYEIEADDMIFLYGELRAGFYSVNGIKSGGLFHLIGFGDTAVLSFGPSVLVGAAFGDDAWQFIIESEARVGGVLSESDYDYLLDFFDEDPDDFDRKQARAVRSQARLNLTMLRIGFRFHF